MEMSLETEKEWKMSLEEWYVEYLIRVELKLSIVIRDYLECKRGEYREGMLSSRYISFEWMVMTCGWVDGRMKRRQRQRSNDGKVGRDSWSCFQ